MANENETMSKSMQKRLEQKKRTEDSRKARKRDAILSVLAIVLIIGALAGLIGYSAYSQHMKKVNTIEPSEDFSAFLNDDGTIKDVNVSDYIASYDPTTIEVEKDSVTYTDAQADSSIQSTLRSNRTLNEDAAAEIADGDTISLDYVGTVDGEEFEGGNTNGNGAELVIGSGSYVDDFEQQLIGHHPGEDVTVDVTFPEDYSSEDLQGKDAQFAVHINGIYVTPEFDDAFVKEHFPEYSTVEEYRAHLIEDNQNSLMDSAIASYLGQNAVLDSYPDKYLRHMKEITVTQQISQFNQQAQMYQYFGVDFPYSDYKQFFTQEGKDYNTVLTEAAQHQTAANMIIQKIASDRGISVSEDDYTAYVEDNSLVDDVIEYYGKPYIKQTILRDKVLESIRGEVTVVDTPDEEPAEEPADTAEESTEETAEGSTEEAAEDSAQAEEETSK